MHGSFAQCISAREILTHRSVLLSGEDITEIINSGNTILHGHSLSSKLDKGEEVDRETVHWNRQETSEPFEARQQSILTMSNITSASGEASVSSDDNEEGDGSTVLLQPKICNATAANPVGQTQPVKRKRNLPGTPDPAAEVIALSPKTLLATNRFVCEICNKGFQRDQNLQLHRRGHNLPWKLKQRASKEIKKRVYVCPEKSCVHHDPSRALGDLTGIKKHFSRKHGEKKWKCEKCSKRYAVQSDWKAHSKTCGTREYRCDCGTLFSRKDSFITHRAFCDALAEESARVSGTPNHSNILVPPKIGNRMLGTLPPGTTSLLHFGGSPMDPISYSSLSAALPASGSRIGFCENGLPSVQPKWEQSYPSGLGTPLSQSRLSLWLGTGPGPGTPGNDQLIVGPQQLQSAPSVSPNTLISDIDFFVPSPKSVQVGTGMMGFLTPSEYDRDKPLAGLNIPSGSFSEGNHNGRVFASDSREQTGIEIAGPGMPGLADLGRTDWTDRSSSAGHLSSATSSGLRSRLACGNLTGADTLSSISSKHAQNHTAQLSATALLQKAVQMGATASKTTLLKGFGMAGSESSSASMESAWQASKPDHGTGMPSHTFTKSLSSLPSASHGLGSSLNSTHFSSAATGTDNKSVYELMNTLSTNGLFGEMSNLPPSLGPYGNSGCLQFSENGPVNNQISSRDSVKQVPPHSSHGGSHNSMLGTSLLAGFGSLPKREDGLSDRFTRDFLGVGHASGMVGSAGGGGRTVSQRYVSSRTSLGTGMETNDFHNSRENLGSLGVCQQSSRKLWDD